MTPSSALARRLFHATIGLAIVDAVILITWYKRYPNYMVLGATVLAFAGLLAMRLLSEDDRSWPYDKWVEGFSTFAVFVLFLAFYAATGSTEGTAFNAHVRQAFALLHGHTYIDAPNWIEHAHFNGHDYQLHPPLPAFLLIPAVEIWGMDANQVIFSLIIGALDVALAWRMLRNFDLDLNARVWLTAFFGAGTIVWTEAVNGGSWEVSMTVAVAFTLLALDEAFGRARVAGWFMGGACGAGAVRSRVRVAILPGPDNRATRTDSRYGVGAAGFRCRGGRVFRVQ